MITPAPCRCFTTLRLREEPITKGVAMRLGITTPCLQLPNDAHEFIWISDPLPELRREPFLRDHVGVCHSSNCTSNDAGQAKYGEDRNEDSPVLAQLAAEITTAVRRLRLRVLGRLWLLGWLLSGGLRGGRLRLRRRSRRIVLEGVDFIDMLIYTTVLESIIDHCNSAIRRNAQVTWFITNR